MLEPNGKSVQGSGLFAICVLMVYEPTDQNSLPVAKMTPVASHPLFQEKLAVSSFHQGCP
jgi:hypothetical protein